MVSRAPPRLSLESAGENGSDDDGQEAERGEGDDEQCLERVAARRAMKP